MYVEIRKEHCSFRMLTLVSAAVAPISQPSRLQRKPVAASKLYRQMPFFVILLLFSFFCITYSKLVQIQVVHRHGARPLIDKHETDPALEENSPTLYPAGIEQLKRLGSYCRSQYIEKDAPFPIDAITDSELERQVFSRTSNFQRTHLSAHAFLSGLYPDRHEQIPTLVFNGTETDWIIRGYAMCPTLAQRFQTFVAQDAEYQKQKKENEAFVSGLAKQLGYDDDEATYENIFNIYDKYNIIQNDYDEELKGIAKLPESEMSLLKTLADWYESHKFFFATHDVHVAGGLVARIIEHARTVREKPKEAYRIVHISAHYPTILTLIASIRSENEGDVAWPADQIPKFGAAVIFEVDEDDDGELWVRMKWFPGEGDIEVKDFAIGRGDCTDAKKGCKLSSVESLLRFDSFREGEFCSECQSTRGMCELVAVEESCSIGARATSGVIGGVLVLVVGLGMWLLHSVCVGKRKRMGVERAAMGGVDRAEFDGDVFA